MIVVATGFLSFNHSVNDDLVLAETFTGITILVFIIPYLVFFLSRYLIRSTIKRVVSGRRLEMSLLRELLDYYLKRSDLEIIQSNRQVRFDHENEPSLLSLANMVINLNYGKFVFIMVLSFAAGIILWLTIKYAPKEPMTWVFTIVIGIWFTILTFEWLKIALLLFRGSANLVITHSGIRDGLGRSNFINYDSIVSLSLDNDRKCVRLRLTNPEGEKLIDCTYYTISATQLQIILEKQISKRSTASREE